MLAVWVHNLEAEILTFTEQIALRWYGLSYLMGFICGYYLLRWLARRELWVLGEEKVGDFIAMAALFGVFLGGRLGFIFLYMIPERGIMSVVQDPLVIFKVWGGGMASHGGILGLAIFTFFYARRHKVSWPGMGDGLVIVSTVGVFFGRVANFINGELYGRATEGVAWAMKFPKELYEKGNREAFVEAMGAAVEVDPGFKVESQDGKTLADLWSDYHVPPSDAGSVTKNLFEGVMEAGRANPEVVQAVGEYLTVRHPSQIYQALLEGLGLFLILLFTRLRWKQLPHGVITGLFFIFYALFRIVAERFREPDSAWIIGGLVTKGQFYSIFMFAIGGAFLVKAFQGKTGRLGEELKEA